MSRPTTTQIGTAVKRLSMAPITNARILDAFADVLPAGYALALMDGTHRGHRGTCWTIQGGPGSGCSLWRPVVKGRGAAIITGLVQAAWSHAGPDAQTRAEQAAWCKANPLPTCPECGKTVLPAESAVSSHPGHHRDCC